MLNTMCQVCAKKRRSLYIQTPVDGREKRGVCKFCYRPALLMQYEETPYQTKYKPARPGGGERAKYSKQPGG